MSSMPIKALTCKFVDHSLVKFLFRMNGMESGFALLPSTPQQICFDKSEFMRDDYKVEQFVSDCKRRVSLEKLRDDLEQVRTPQLVRIMERFFSIFVC